MASGIIITGTSGSGKTTIVYELCKQNKYFKLVQAITTRSQRSDDPEDMYDYISIAEFEKLDKNKSLIMKASYRDKYYGIRLKDVQHVISLGKIPILPATPESAHQIVPHPVFNFMCFFIDAPDNLLDTRLLGRDSRLSEQRKDLRIMDRQNRTEAMCVIENLDLQKSISEILKRYVIE